MLVFDVALFGFDVELLVELLVTGINEFVDVPLVTGDWPPDEQGTSITGGDDFGVFKGGCDI